MGVTTRLVSGFECSWGSMVLDADGKLWPLTAGWGPKSHFLKRTAQQSMGSGRPSQALSFETTDQT